MNRYNTTTYEAITTAERHQIAGRFCKVDEGDNFRVIGTVGSLWPHDLNRRQRQHLAALHFLDADGAYKFEVLNSYPNSKLPAGNFNGFLKITKEENKK